MARSLGLPPDGAVEAISFDDANGYNQVVLREGSTETQVTVNAEHAVDAGGAGGERRVLRQVRDFEGLCGADEPRAWFVPNSLSVHDHDDDGIGEVLFAYRRDCRGDVGPASQRLLLLENGDKYILRGTASTSMDPPPDEPEPEPAPEQWPPGTYERALRTWQELPEQF